MSMGFFAGLAAFFYGARAIKTGDTSLPLPAGVVLPTLPGYLSETQVKELAAKVLAGRGFNVTVPQLVAIAKIESSFRPKAYRYEKHIDDASYGLTQVLWKTAQWLRDDKGYRAYRLTKAEDLYDPEVGLYYGAAYIDWLRRAYRGTFDQTVRRYNGGPKGDTLAATVPYLEKFKKAYAEVA